MAMTVQTHGERLAAAIRAEQTAYATMRDLVPDLSLPAAQRRPLSRRQKAAVVDYAHACERLRRVRQTLQPAESAAGQATFS
jgi:hypothetical protein